MPLTTRLGDFSAWAVVPSGLPVQLGEPTSGERVLMAVDNDSVPPDFDSVVAEHGPYLWRVLRRIGVRTADVEDVLQETFIVVHRKLDGFEGRASVRTWLSAIA